MYMLDSDQEPSYNLSKNLLLLKLIEDVVDDSTPLLNCDSSAKITYISEAVWSLVIILRIRFVDFKIDSKAILKLVINQFKVLKGERGT